MLKVKGKKKASKVHDLDIKEEDFFYSHRHNFDEAEFNFDEDKVESIHDTYKLFINENNANKTNNISNTLELGNSPYNTNKNPRTCDESNRNKNEFLNRKKEASLSLEETYEIDKKNNEKLEALERNKKSRLIDDDDL